MAVTPGYDPSGLSPKILIRDYDENIVYTFESDEIAASPTKDFNLRSGAFHLGLNDDFGYFSFVIDDPNNNLTDGTCKASPLIRQQYDVELWLGKNSTNLNRWFYGKVISVTVARPMTDFTQLMIVCANWGIKTKYRYTNIKRFQDKTADGISLDSTDTDAKVSELVKDIFQDTDHFLAEGFTSETEITVTGVQDVDIKLADFQQTGQSWASAVSTLAAWSNAYWGIDGDRDVFFHQVGSQDSGFFFTNDLEGIDAQGWDADKIGYLKNTVFEWENSSTEGALSVLHGLGGNTVNLDEESNPTPNSLFTMDSSWLAWRITPGQNNYAKVALSLNRTGTPASGKAAFFIVGDDGASKPNMEDIRGAGFIGESKLQALPTTGTNWVEIGFDIKGGVPVNPQDTIYFVMKGYGTASHNYGIENDTTTDVNYWTSTNGSSWTLVSGASGVKFLYRTYANRPITVTLEDLVAKRKYGTRELPFSLRQDVQVETIQEGLIQASETLGKERRMYNNVIVSPMTDRLPLGKYCRVRDNHSGLDTLVDIIAIDAEFAADNVSNLGIRNFTLTLQEIQG